MIDTLLVAILKTCVVVGVSVNWACSQRTSAKVDRGVGIADVLRYAMQHVVQAVEVRDVLRLRLCLINGLSDCQGIVM